MPTIKAAVVRDRSGPFYLEEIELDEPRENEVLVRIMGTGLCHTDLAVRDQHLPMPLPAVLGHEGAGVVEKTGSAVTKVVPGDHVVLSFASCGICDNCQKGLPGYCPELYMLNFSGRRTDGSSPCCARDGGKLSGLFFGQSSFGDYALATERNVVKIRKDVPIELMGPLGCGIQTGAGAVMNALKPEAGASIAIFGLGPVGMAAVLAARVVGCSTIIAIDINPTRLALAAELGATHVVNSKTTDAVAQIRSITGEGAQHSLDCTGIPSVIRQAVESLRITGVCGILGVAPLGTEIGLDLNSILFGRTVRGIVEGDSIPDIFIPRLVELWQQGRFPFDKLVRKYPLAEINEAVRASESGEVLKAILVP